MDHAERRRLAFLLVLVAGLAAIDLWLAERADGGETIAASVYPLVIAIAAVAITGVGLIVQLLRR
ncbi:MAG TPA: hypothetical protein VIA10_11565 [Gaiellaceae bacterium]|jgi:hypothetical protein